MTSTISKNNIRDYLGQVVSINDLNKIYDLWMILVRPKNSTIDNDKGILSFVGTETNAESDKLYTPENVIIPIFNDSTELDGDVFYDE